MTNYDRTLNDIRESEQLLQKKLRKVARLCLQASLYIHEDTFRQDAYGFGVSLGHEWAPLVALIDDIERLQKVYVRQVVYDE